MRALTAAAVGAIALAAPAIAQARSADVTIVNTREAPANVTVVGTTAVEISSGLSSPVYVREAREPFQQYVAASTTAGEACEAIIVPTGKRLTIESFSAEATSTNKPSVYLRVTTQFTYSTTFRRPFRLPLENIAGSQWAGDGQTLLHSGAAGDDNGGVFSYSACVAGQGANASFTGFVSGWLEGS